MTWSPPSASSYGVCMPTSIRSEQREPLTFANAPTFQRGDVTYVERSAGLELVQRLADRDEDLLKRLAEE